MSQADWKHARADRAVYYVGEIAGLVSFVIRKGRPQNPAEAMALLQQYLKEHFPTAEQLEQLSNAAHVMNGIMPNLIIVIQHEAQQRLEEV